MGNCRIRTYDLCIWGNANALTAELSFRVFTVEALCYNDIAKLIDKDSIINILENKMRENKKISNRERTLTLQYESLRKDFDVILTSMIPTQKNLMKTIMWINVTIIGLVVSQHDVFLYKSWLLVPLSFSTFAFLLILWSLKTGRMKMLAQMDTQEIHSIESDKFEVIYGLIKLIETIEVATKNNMEIIISRGKSISHATNFTLASTIFSIVFVIIQINFIL